MASNPYSDPYAAPLPAGAAVYKPSKPGALLLVAILALVMGVLGLLGACMVVAITPFQSQMQAALNQPGQGNVPPAIKLQQQMNLEMQAVMDKYFVGTMGFGVLHLVLATCMIIGAIMVLRTSPAGRGFLIWTLLAVIVFEVLRTAMTVVMQLEVMPITTTYVERMMREAGNNAAPMAGVMKAAMYFGIIFGVIWPLGKMVLYGLSARYLASQKIVEFFESQNTSFQKPYP